MLAGDFLGGDVTTYMTRVTVNGVDRPAVSVDLSASMRSDLPSQISRGGSMERSGKVEWATEQDVQDRPVTAFRDWGVWRPQKGDEIVIYAGDGVTEWRRFTGLVDETTGSVGTGMSSTIIVDVDRLSNPFSCEPMLRRMPPLEGSTQWRRGRLSPWYFVDAALRAGGYYATQPTLTTHAINVPLQSSLFPAPDSGGVLTTSAGISHPDSDHVNSYNHPWGITVGDFSAYYRPRISRPASDPVMLSMMVAAEHASPAHVTVRYGDNYVRLMVSGTRRAVVQRYYNGTLSEVCSISASDMSGATRVEVLVKNGVATLRNNTGHEASGSFPSLGGTSDRISILAWENARIAGVQVSHPVSWQEFQYLNVEPQGRMRITPGSLATWGLTARSPRYLQRSALSMLEDLADQTLSAMWFDEYQVLHFAPSGGLRGTPLQQTITTSHDVLALAWSDRLLASASRVTVEYDEPIIKATDTRRTIEVYRGSKQQLDADDEFEDVVSPPADVDWYGVDEAPYTLPGAGWQNYNLGLGSYMGFTYMRDRDPIEDQSQYSAEVTFTKIGINEYIFSHRAPGLPGGVTAETTTHPTTSFLWERNRDEPLPVLRAWAMVEWVNRETTATTGQPGPHLRVSLGPQATDTTAVSVRDYLVGLIQNAYPQITNLDVTPDPRRQLGDHVRIQSEDFLGVTIRGMITGIEESYTPEGATQSLTLDVLDVSAGSLTWEEWEQAFPGTLTYDHWRALRDSTDTYDDFNTDPLKGDN